MEKREMPCGAAVRAGTLSAMRARNVVASVILSLLAGCSSAPSAAPPPPPAPAPSVPVAEPCARDAASGAPSPATFAGAPDVLLARAIADRYMAVHPATSASWNWDDGTLMASLMALHRVTGGEAYRDYVQAWIDARIASGYAISTSDHCPPALSALALYTETCDPRYQAVVDRVTTFLDVEALRTPEGGISHFGTSSLFGATLWIDSLYMFGEVAIRRGAAWGDAGALDLYGAQYRIFATALQDAGGFFRHAYDWPGAQDPGVFWARGNGWVLASGADYLHARSTRGESDDVVRASYQRLAAAVVDEQDPATGLFWTIVNARAEGETYLETSATALFALGLARGSKDGLVDASARAAITRAMEGVRAQITKDAEGRPVVTGISGPTDVGRRADYAAVPLESDVSYGVGAVILALIEVADLP
jgi:unsaturated rhamnogalacturonyl hydrolase